MEKVEKQVMAIIVCFALALGTCVGVFTYLVLTMA